MGAAVAEPAGTVKGGRTREAILDGAERAFAQHSFDGVSSRQIADASGQALGVLTYHFPSKEGLFEAVVRRRAGEITMRRCDALAALKDPTIEQVLEAFLGPFLERIEHGGEGWRHYARLLAHITHEDRWAPLLNSLFGEASLSFIRSARAAEPSLSVNAANQGYVHLISVMVGLFSSNALIDRLSNGRLRSDDIRAHYAPTIKFVAGGLRALARQETGED